MIFRAIVLDRDYQRAMRSLTKAEIPGAQSRAINVIAKACDSQSHRNLGERMILRNKYTVNSLRYSPSKVRSGGRVGYAEIGTVSPYLPIQETGGVVRAQRKKIPVPTIAARGKSMKRVVMKQFRMNTLGPLGKGHRFFMLPSGIYYRPGIGRKHVKGRPRPLVKVRDLSKSRITIKPTRWHTDAVKKFGTQAHMVAAFKREARRLTGAT